MTEDRTKRTSPLSPFVYCAAITVGLLIAGGFVFATRYREMVEIETMAGRLTYLDSIIVRLNDTQTMCAKMAAATGDPAWEVRYHSAERSLDAAIEEAVGLALAAGQLAANEAVTADAALDAMEARSLALSREGKLTAASAVFDASYDALRQLYANSMDASMNAISVATSKRVDQHRHTMLVVVCLGAAALAVLTFLWLHLLGLIRRYIRDRSEAEAQLRSAHATLESRVEERTREVAASREQYRFLVENTDAVSFEWDPTTYRMLYIAPQAARMLECPVDALQDEALLDKVLHDGDRVRFRARIDQFVASDHPCTVDFRVITGAKRTATIRMCLGGRVHRSSFGVMLDITNQVKLESELLQAQKLEAIGRLAAGVAHEINTPMQFIADSVQFIHDSLTELIPIVVKHRRATQAALLCSSCGELARDANDAEAQVDMAYLSKHLPEATDLALEGLSRVAAIVRSMKVFAHPDRKEKSHADLNEAISSTLTIAHSEYKYVADLETHLGDLPAVYCHIGELNQVFLNLLVNAAHAIGDVVATKGRGRITVATRREGRDVVISIGDSGTGIPAEIRDRVFEPFFTTKETGKGTGQGLSHARSVIIDKHHGELTFDTVAGVGTTFYIRLPIDDAAHDEVAA